jgi:hypothetical protein
MEQIDVYRDLRCEDTLRIGRSGLANARLPRYWKVDTSLTAGYNTCVRPHLSNIRIRHTTPLSRITAGAL